MGELTLIAWCDATVNFWWGCTRVSPGCVHCYAEAFADKRLGRVKWGPGEPRLKINGAIALVKKLQARAVRERRRIRAFSNSMADFFDAEVCPAWRSEAWEAMRLATDVDFLLLTKRAENLLLPEYFPADWGDGWANVWLGVTAENQEWANRRVPLLLRARSRIHWVSYEPALDTVDFRPWLGEIGELGAWTGFGQRLDWIVVGGESGHGARPFDVAWARRTIRACKRAGVPVFCKQLGAYVVDRNDAGFEAETHVWDEGPEKGLPVDAGAWPTPVDVEHDLDGFINGYQGAPVRVHLHDSKGGDPAEWPTNLRVREWPGGCA